MEVLLIVHPGETPGRTSTALDLAAALVRNEDTRVRIFFVGPGKAASDAPDRIHALVAAGVEIRAIDPEASDTLAEARRDLFDIVPAHVRDLAAATLKADRVLVF